MMGMGGVLWLGLGWGDYSRFWAGAQVWAWLFSVAFIERKREELHLFQKFYALFRKNLLTMVIFSAII
jgi:hypothetical protein